MKPSRVIPIVDAGRAPANPGAGVKTGTPRDALPLSLYVHIPWCVQKCPYCDFNSHQVRAQIPEKEYVAALIADIESALPLIWGRRVSTVFFGGGTPSLLSGAAIDELIKAFRARVTLLPDAEITLEANPGTVESEKFAAFRDAGVNRLSLGIQSFNARHLQALGRIHDDNEARRAIEIAARYFDNFNLDLMYGLPAQNPAQALDDLECALAYTPPHLSCYQLTLEPNTAFAAAAPVLPDPDHCADMQEAIEARLAGEGYTHYETSAFARSGRECRHNLNYWTFGDYLGVGAGAHGKLTLAAADATTVRRQMRARQPKDYLARIARGTQVAEEFDVAAAQLPFEFMMNALRLSEGFAPALFAARTGLRLSTVEAALQRAEEGGLLTRSVERIAPTLRGQRFLNRLLELFLDDAN